MKSRGHSYPIPLFSPPRWCLWDIFRSFKVCSYAKERVGCGRQREATTYIESLVKLQPWYLSLQWKTCLWAELWPWFLSLQWTTCPWAEYSDDDDDDDDECVCSNANPLHYCVLWVPHKADRWHWVWSIFNSRTTWADHISCRMSICKVYCRKLRLGWLYV